MKKICLSFFVIALALTSFAQNLKPIAQKITNANARQENFQRTQLFTISSGTQQRSQLANIVSDATLLQFNRNDAQQIVASRPANINFIIPANGGSNLELQLFESDIFTPDFSVTTSGSSGQPVAYNGGVHYWGIIKGDNTSLAAISIFNDEVMGLISSPSIGNLVLGKMENDVNDVYVFYNDRNLKAAPPTQCFTENDNQTYQARPLQNANHVLPNCIRLFWEVNLDIYNNKGSVANVVNYVTGLFNQSAIIYTNDAIPVELSEIFVWNTTSPYTSTSTSGLLGQFQTFRNSINGDLGHLLGFAGGGGIAAGFSGFCASNLNSSQCYSGISSSYQNFPTYSWSVMVVTHEQGHLMGSRHTHACVWNGNNTAIDNCGPTAGYGYEGSCSGAPTPVGGGTIMSYCHLVGGVGINLSNGFGTQPKNLIINNFNNAACLTACLGTACMPSANMSTASVLTTTATFNWAAATGATSYNVRYRIVGAGTWTTGTSASASFNATSLTPGSNYEWQVQTVCSGGSSIFTISSEFITVPLSCVPPSNLSTTNIAYSSATFNWAAASGATSYNIQYRIVGTTTWTTATATSVFYNAFGLTASSNYEWQVRTQCSGGGISSYSASVLFTTPAQPCNPPVNNYTSNITSSSATFNWGGGPTGGGGNFNIRYRIIGTSIWTNATDSLSPYVATGLTPSSNYEWQVQAICTGGQSSFSGSVTFTTLCATPPATISAGGPTTFCAGGSVLLTANSGGYTYQWLLNDNPIAGMVSMNYSASASGNYSVVVSSGVCSATSAAITVTVNQLPTVTANNVSGCEGTSISLSGTPAGGTWSVANPYTGPGTTYTHTYTDANGCTNTSTAANITVHPLPSVSFSGLAGSYHVSEPAAALTGLPTGGIFSGPGISGSTFNPGTAGVGGPYTIIYSYTDGNGCSNTASQQTTVVNCTAAPAKPGTITAAGGNIKVCPGDSKTYSITAVSGAVSYTWIPPPGGLISSGQGTISVTVNYTSGFTATDSLKVYASNNCGSGPYKALKITRNTPATPGAISGQNYGVCNSSNIPYSVANVSGIGYDWSFSVGNASVTGGQGTNSIMADYNPGYITGQLRVTANNACGTSNHRTLTVKATPATPVSITGATSVCANQQGVPYSTPPITSATTYTWTGPSGSRISDGVVTSTTASLTTTATSVIVNYKTTAGTLKVKGNNVCGSGSTKSITIIFTCREEDESSLNNSNFNIYPNPSTGQFILEFNPDKKYGHNLIEIYNSFGQSILKNTIELKKGENRKEINLSKFPSGIYFLNLKTEKEIFRQKIVKQ